MIITFSDLFRLCPPSLVGAYYLQPPDARAIFLHNDLLCNGTCAVAGGRITYWGGTNGKDPRFQIDTNFNRIIFTIGGQFKHARASYKLPDLLATDSRLQDFSVQSAKFKKNGILKH